MWSLDVDCLHDDGMMFFLPPIPSRIICVCVCVLEKKQLNRMDGCGTTSQVSYLLLPPMFALPG